MRRKTCRSKFYLDHFTHHQNLIEELFQLPESIPGRARRIVRLQLQVRVCRVCAVHASWSTHTAAFVERTGAVLQMLTFPATPAGYSTARKAAAKWPNHAWAIEGSSSFGAGFARSLRKHCDGPVIEVDHPKRPARRNGSKNDDLDAVRAAREVLARPELGEPRTGDSREALRVLHVTRRIGRARTNPGNERTPRVSGHCSRRYPGNVTRAYVECPCSQVRFVSHPGQQPRSEIRASLTAMRSLAVTRAWSRS